MKTWKIILATLLFTTTIVAANKIKRFDENFLRFGKDATAVRKIQFDKSPDGNTAEIAVNPADDYVSINRRVNLLDELHVTGLTQINNRLAVTSTTQASRPCPVMTLTERNLLTPAQGDCIWNSTDNVKEDYDGTDWIQSGSGVGGSRLNLIIDNSFEKDVSQGTCTGCTPSVETTVVELTDTNAQSLEMAFTASAGDYTDTTTTNAQYSGVVGLVSARIKTDQQGVELCSIVDGAESACTKVRSDNTWDVYKINSFMSSTNFGYKVVARNSITGSVFVDEVFAGASEIETSVTVGKTEEFHAYGYAGKGSTNTYVMYYSNIQENTLDQCLSYVNNATSGLVFTAIAKCEIKANVWFDNATTADWIGFVRNGILNTQLSNASNDSKRLSATRSHVASNTQSTSTTVTLNPGDTFAALTETTTAANAVGYANGIKISATPVQQKSVITSIKDDTLSEWKPFTPTGTWSSNVLYQGRYRRVGDSMEISVNVSLTGAPNATFLAINIPFGKSIDTSKVVDNQVNVGHYGQGMLHDSGTGTEGAWVRADTSTSVRVVTEKPSAVVTESVPFVFAAGDDINVYFKVPIVGWTNTPTAATAAATATKARYAYLGSVSSNATVETKHVLTIEKDPFGMVDTGAGRINIDQSGEYELCTYGSTPFGDVNWVSHRYKVNGGATQFLGALTPTASSGDNNPACRNISLNSGDYVEMYFGSGSAALFSDIHHTITRIRDEDGVFIGNVDLKGYVKAPGSLNTVMVSAQVQDAAGTTIVTEEDDDFINGNCSNGSLGSYSCSFNTDYWASKPHCWFQIISLTVSAQRTIRVSGLNTTVASISMADTFNNGADGDFLIFCKGEKL